MARRSGAILPVALLALCFVVARQPDAFTGHGSARASSALAQRGLASGRQQPLARLQTALAARGGDDDDDSVEVSGFSGLVVGLALMPHILYVLYTVYDVVVNGAALTTGPYGLTVVTALTTVGLTFWSLGSFVGRGKGLPAGPLGLFGLAEGLSYVATLAISFVLVTTNVKDLPKFDMPKLDGVGTSLSKIEAPKFDAPKFDLPKFDAPKFDAPKFDAPKFDFKAPEIKLPDAPKLPEAKKEEPKKEEPKKEEPKEEPKKEEAKPKPEPKKEEPKAAPKAAPAQSQSFSDLFE